MWSPKKQLLDGVGHTGEKLLGLLVTKVSFLCDCTLSNHHLVCSNAIHKTFFVTAWLIKWPSEAQQDVRGWLIYSLTNFSSQSDLEKNCPGSHSTRKLASPYVLPSFCLDSLMKLRSCKSKAIRSLKVWFPAMKLYYWACILHCYIPPVISGVYGVLLYFFSWNALKENLYPAFHPADTEFQWRVKWFTSSLLSIKRWGSVWHNIIKVGTISKMSRGISQVLDIFWHLHCSGTFDHPTKQS